MIQKLRKAIEFTAHISDLGFFICVLIMLIIIYIMINNGM